MRGKFNVWVTCDECGKEVQIIIPEYNLRLGHSFVTECLFDMNWVVDSAKDIEYCPHCCPVEEEREGGERDA